MSEVINPPTAVPDEPAKQTNWKTALKAKLESVQETLKEKPMATGASSAWSAAQSSKQVYQGEILTQLARNLGIIGEDEPLTYAHFTENGEALTTELRVFINSIEMSLKKQKTLFESIVKEGDPADNEGLETDWFRHTTDMRLYTFVVKGHFRAWGFMLPPMGEGRVLDATELFNKLEEQRICFGEDLQAIIDATKNNLWLKLIPIAKGVEPQNGTDGSIVEHFKRNTSAHLSVNCTEDEIENIDYRNMNWLQNVEAGTVLCDIIPPTECVDGTTVYNETVAAKPGKPAKVPRGEHTSVAEDGTVLVADIAGHVEFRNNQFCVQSSLNIAGSVDISTGNLNVIGDVVIGGNVASGFSVCATGNIVVRGLVEGATLKAEKDIQVGLGVKGNKKGVLEAKGSVICKYIESSHVVCGGDLLSETIINSTVQCGGSVMVMSGRGMIIGGITNAKKSISARAIGNDLNRSTAVNAGVELPTAVSVSQLKEEIETTKLLCDELREKIDFINGMHSTDPAFQKKLQQLTLQRSVKKMARVKLEKQLQERLEEQQKLNPTIMANTIYPSVVISISGRRKKIISTTKGCRFYLRDGELANNA